jgi:hypothetical protein
MPVATTTALLHDDAPSTGRDVGGVEEDVGEGRVAQGSVAEGGDDPVELGADAADLALADAGVDARGRRRGRRPC